MADQHSTPRCPDCGRPTKSIEAGRFCPNCYWTERLNPKTKEASRAQRNP